MRLRNFMLINEIILILVPICIISMVVLNIMNDYLRNEVFKKNDIIAHSMAIHIDDLRTDPLHLLEQMRDAYQTGILREENQIDAYMATLMAHQRFFESIEIVNSRGEVTHVAPFHKEVIGIQRSGHDFFKEIHRGKESYWSSSFISSQTGHNTVVLAIPMEDMILVGYLNLEYISEISNIFEKQYGKDTVIAITDETGKYISHYDIERVFQRQTEERFHLIKAIGINSGESYRLEHSEKDRLVSFEKLENPNWYVLVSQSYESAFGTINTVIRMFFITALLAIGGAIFFSRYKTAYIMRFFEKMNQQTDEIAAGDYKAVVSYGHFEEFNQLADRFNQMVSNIGDRDEKLKRMAYLDSLTGLANRMSFKEFLTELTQVKEGREKSAILFLDLDNFKWINDTYGHSFGDEVLKVISNKLSECMNEGDFIARLGGDEFVLTLVNFKDKSAVEGFLENLINVFRFPIHVHGYTLYSQMSIGVAIYPDDSENVDDLLKVADTAMYYAKEHGKNNYQFYNRDMLEGLQRKVTIEKALRTALDKKEFELYYQPLIELRTGRIRGFEALLRWNSEELGFVPPLEFIGIAEETGLIIAIGKWVMETACKKVAEWNGLHGTELIISVNVSALQLRNKDFINVVQEAIDDNGINPEELEIEITESVFIDSFEETSNILGKIQSLGVSISLDDFGTGYSSLSYLRKLPINTIKIDKSFISDVLYNSRSKSLLETIILLAKKLQLSVVAEGIEDQNQLDHLLEYHCDYVQGYLFSKPISSSAVNQYYENYVRQRKLESSSIEEWYWRI